jgi:hypothetical protein
MPVKIKVRGTKTEDKPAPAKRGSTRSTKPAGRKATTRKGTAPAKRAPARSKPAAAAKTNGNGDGPVRRASKGVDPRTEARLLKAVAKAGERRTKAEIEHKESINALHDAAREAIAEGVSMAKVADESGISRQWLYKMGEFAEREGVTSGNGKTATKKAPAKRASGAKATTRPSTRGTRSTGTRRGAASKPAASTRRSTGRVKMRSK